MLCPRCNTELPDSASICSQCGSPIFAAAPMQPQVSSFSYLPSGTPPWPTTASGQLPFPLAGQTPRTYNGTPLATSDMAEAERPKRKSGSLSWPAVLLVLFASVLVGGGLSFGALALQNRGNSPQQLPAISLTHPATLLPRHLQRPARSHRPPAPQGINCPRLSHFSTA